MNQDKQGPSDLYRDVTEPGWRAAEAERERKMGQVLQQVPLLERAIHAHAVGDRGDA